MELIAKSTVFDESSGCMHMHYNNCIQFNQKHQLERWLWKWYVNWDILCGERL